MLRHWAETRLPLQEPRIRRHVESFFMACVAVDILLLAKRRLTPADQAAADLRAALVRHLNAHKALYGDDSVKPKHHWAFDICEQLEKDPVVYDSFVIERLHLRLKAVAEHCKRLEDFETSVLSGVVLDHCRKCEGATFAHCMLGKSCPLGLETADVSDTMELRGARATVGDFVSHGDSDMGCVVACALEDGQLFVVVDAWDKVRDVSLHSALWRCGGRRLVWHFEAVIECLAWQEQPADEMLVIRM